MSTSVLHLAPRKRMHEWKSSAYSFQIPRRASLQNHQKHAFLPASSRIFSGLLLGLIGLCFIAAAGEVVTWQAGSAYSDTFPLQRFCIQDHPDFQHQ